MLTDTGKTEQHDPPDSGDPRFVLQACEHAVGALTRALELHDYRRGRFAETSRHIESVTGLALDIAHRLGLDQPDDPQLGWGFRLHDIGMLGVSTGILAQEGPLTAEQLDEVREHPWIGERIVASVPYLGGVARQVIGSHHEKWDGTGYPRGLAGTEIPLAARVFALADVFDVMTNDQPYRQALPLELALSEIAAKSGSHFDPELVPVCIQVVTGGEAAATG